MEDLTPTTTATLPLDEYRSYVYKEISASILMLFGLCLLLQSFREFIKLNGGDTDLHQVLDRHLVATLRCSTTTR